MPEAATWAHEERNGMDKTEKALEKALEERNRFEAALIGEAKLRDAERVRADRLERELEAVRLEKAAPGIDRAAFDHAAAELAKAKDALERARAELKAKTRECTALSQEAARLREELEEAKREAPKAQEPAEPMRDLAPEFGEGLVTVREWAESLAGVHVDTVGSWLWVTGDTRAHKDALKAAGFLFSAKKGAWYWKPAGSAPKTRRARYGSVDALKSHWSAA